MRKLTLAFVLMTTAVVGAQSPEPLPKELDVLKSMTGTWRGQLTMGGASESQIQDTMTVRMGVGGRYQIQDHEMDVPGMGRSQGMQMLTYEPMRKKYVAWWFDSQSEGMVEMEGTMTGNTLVLTSTKPARMGGQMMDVRATTTMESPASMKFKMEMKSGTNWVTSFEGTYTKS